MKKKIPFFTWYHLAAAIAAARACRTEEPEKRKNFERYKTATLKTQRTKRQTQQMQCESLCLSIIMEMWIIPNFFSPLLRSFDVIYFSCIRSNWNYTPYVYYMTFMRLDQCRRRVFTSNSHKPSAYEKKRVFLFFHLVGCCCSFSQCFFIPYIISQFDIAFFARVCVFLYLLFHCIFFSSCYVLSANFIYLYSSTQ